MINVPAPGKVAPRRDSPPTPAKPRFLGGPPVPPPPPPSLVKAPAAAPDVPANVMAAAGAPAAPSSPAVSDSAKLAPPPPGETEEPGVAPRLHECSAVAILAGDGGVRRGGDCLGVCGRHGRHSLHSQFDTGGGEACHGAAAHLPRFQSPKHLIPYCLHLAAQAKRNRRRRRWPIRNLRRTTRRRPRPPLRKRPLIHWESSKSPHRSSRRRAVTIHWRNSIV